MRAVRYPTLDQGPICYIPSPDRPWAMELGVNRWYADNGIPEKGSVHQYIIGHCEPHLAGSLCDQINCGHLMPGKGTRNVPQPDRAGASEAYIKSVYCSQKSATVVQVEAVLVADLTLYVYLGDLTVTDQREEWFRVCGEWDLADDETTGPLWGPFTVYRPAGQAKERPLDEYLIPIMNHKARQSEAEQMLRTYYPEALERAVRLDPRILAARMGLRIRYLPLVGHDAYLAMLFFKSDNLQIADRDTGEILTVEVQRDTIVVNARTVAINEVAKAAKAIIHECMHRYSHRLFLLFQQRYCEEIAYLTCPVDIGRTYDDPRDPLRWLEIQADGLTLAVQVPDATVRREAEARMQRYGGQPGYRNRADVMQMVVRDLSTVYGVAKRQMRKRLIELGYEDAVGAYDWVDGGYVPPYCFAPGSIGKNQTYTIGWEALAQLCDENEALRTLMARGSLVYVEGHLCLNQEEYIDHAAKRISLTQYGRAHVHKCCLRFDIVYHRRAPQYRQGVLHSELTVVGKEYRIDTDNIEEVCALKKKILDDARRVQDTKNMLPADGAGTLFTHMQRQNMTVEQLAETVRVSETSIKKWRKDDENVPPIRTAVAICIALHLEPDLSTDYLGKLGILFRLTDDHRILKFVLERMYLSSIEVCNEFMAAAGFKPLVKDEIAAEV